MKKREREGRREIERVKGKARGRDRKKTELINRINRDAVRS